MPNPIPEHDAFIADGNRVRRCLKVLIKLRGPEHVYLPKDGPALFAGNHRSLLDIFVTVAVLARFEISCALLVRADLFDKPVIGHWLKRIGCIPMSSRVAETAITTAIAALERGEMVAIMPEGRLVPAEERRDGVGPPRAGVSRIAMAAKVPVLPVAFHNTESVWPRGRMYPLPKMRRPDVSLTLGRPEPLHGEDHHENAEHVMDSIRAILATVE